MNVGDVHSRACRRALMAAAMLSVFVSALPAQAQSVRISKLANISFGNLATTGADRQRTERFCAYSTAPGNVYNVTATGSGTNGAFILDGASATLEYEVQYSSDPAATTGTDMTPGVALTGQVTTATAQTCNSGPANTATLIAIIRGTTITSATAGSYTGTLTLVLAPN